MLTFNILTGFMLDLSALVNLSKKYIIMGIAKYIQVYKTHNIFPKC